MSTMLLVGALILTTIMIVGMVSIPKVKKEKEE